MDELFIQLCAAVAATIEPLKPFLKKWLGVSDTDTTPNLAYQAVVKLIALGVGIIFAIGAGVNITPSWLNVSDAAGYLITGLLASLGSEVAHRILELLRALSGFMQNKASTQTVKAEQTSTRTQTLTAPTAAHDVD